MESRHGQGDAQEHIKRAILLAADRKLSEAQAHCAKALSLSPNHFGALHLSGLIACQLGQNQDGIELFDKAIGINPDVAEIHNDRGMALRGLRRWNEALASFDKAIALKPDYAAAHHNRGLTLRNLERLDGAFANQLKPDLAQAHFDRAIMLHRAKRRDEAVASYDKAIQAMPTFAEAYNNRGIILSELGRPEEAIASYSVAIGLNGRLAEAYNNRGTASYELRRWNDALADYDMMIRLKNDDKNALHNRAQAGNEKSFLRETAQAYCNRGNVLLKMGRLDEAIADYSKAIELNPNECSYYLSKSWTLERLKEPGLARDVLREAERRFSDNEEVRFNLSRLADGPTPISAPASHVERLFDGYADTFESHLVEGLQYKTPELIASCLLKHAASRALDILDLGCGTGLMGSLLATRKRTMVGVDLSSRMIAKAREKGIYDELHVADIVAFLTASARRFDVVLAADVFVYLGDLSPVVQAARRVLMPSGLFAFSVERCAEGDYVLGKSGRYSHSQDYIQRLAAIAGFETLLTENAILRHQDGEPVEGTIAVLRSP